MYKCMYTSVRPCNIYMTVNILVKHPRSGLPPTVLYNLLYLHYITSLKNPLQEPVFYNCSFSVAGPTALNSLPNQVKNASSLETYKPQLKTHLFKQSHNCH